MALSVSSAAVLAELAQITLSFLVNGENVRIAQAHIIATRVIRVIGSSP